jgi:hypothetical protein
MDGVAQPLGGSAALKSPRPWSLYAMSDAMTDCAFRLKEGLGRGLRLSMPSETKDADLLQRYRCG